VAREGARRRIAPIVGAASAVVVVGGLTAAAVVVPGYDVKDVPQVSTTVWVTRDSGDYARVNTDLHELDTVKAVAEPAGVVQNGVDGLIFTQGYLQTWGINPAYPADLVDGESGGGPVSTPSPSGTDAVTSAGVYVLYQTSTSEVYLGIMPSDGSGVLQPSRLDPFVNVEVAEGEDPPTYVADAAAVDADGRVAMYSGAEGGVRIYDSTTSSFVGDMTPVPTAPDQGTELAMTMADGHWVMYSPVASTLWIEGLDSPVSTTLGTDAVLQDGSSDSGRALLADATGLVAVAVADGAVTRLADATGRPAAPIEVDGVAFAAWLDTAAGTLWSSATGETTPLQIEQGALDDVRVIAPVFRSNGDRAVLSETTTGMVWTVPDGQLIPTDEWEPLSESETLEGTVEVDDVVDQEPPVAADDAFGVRRGALVMLPLLLNDSDPNKKDVLTVSATNVSGLSDPSFGTIGLVENDQQAVVQVAAASGSATFTYAASDGFATSNTASVSLTVVPDDQNTAPQWCPMDNCTQELPRPQVAPGGYVELDALSGWVDAEGDAIALADAYAVDPQAPVTVVPTADGTVVLRHTDPNGSDATIPLVITVTDSFGATTDMDIDLRVTGAPALDVKPIAITAAQGEEIQASIGDWVSGGSGSYRLVDATSTTADALTVSPSTASGVITLTADAPGEYSGTYTVEDTQTLAQQTAVLRVTVPEASRALIAAPLTAFVRPGEDTTVDVLSSVRSSAGKVLALQSAVTSSPDLSVSVVDQTYVRVSASTTAVPTGPLGTAEVLIADGSGATTTTQVTVFLLQPSHGIGPVAAPDTVSVRAGQQVDIPVLANDSSPRGERLLLSPDVVGSGAQGELAFGSGSVVRYLAPAVPGVYTLTYATYLEADAARRDTATITVTVLAAGSNRPPQPPTLEARVLAGQAVTIAIPTSSIDPDGDPVTVVDVSQPSDGVASVSATTSAVTYRAPATGIASGQAEFTYTVRDAGGETARGTVKVGVLSTDADVAPVTYADRVAVQTGSLTPITVTPLANDHDPAKGELTLLEVRPNAIPNSDEYARLESLIVDDTQLGDGVVVLRAGDVEGTASFIYTVESDSTFSTAQGLIVLSVSDDPAPDGMVISDTVLTAQNRRDLLTGVDVLTGKVSWPTGDAASLTLSLWGDAAERYRVNGSSIIGDLPEEGDVVPFAVTGADASGADVTSYGFLRIPAFNDLRLQRAPLAPLQVGEEQSVSFSIRDQLQLAGAEQIELREDDSYVVQRDNAVCSPSGADEVTYAAGREAPWTDTCSVAVRLRGQDTWSIVAVPLNIEPKDPMAILNPVTRTVTPGADATVDMLAEMLTWEGGRVGDVTSLDLSVSYSGTAFEVTQTGNSVSIQAFADSRPGTRETILVSSDAFGGLRSAITVVVGAALPDAPYGATFTQACDVSASRSCTITAVGLATEYDPYAGKPHAGLTIAAVGTKGSVVCDVATVTQASDTTLVATWPSGAKPLGGECVVDFMVKDAQGKTGPGKVTVDVQGFAPAPQSITTANFDGTSVTLGVKLGEAALTHPAVTGVAIYEGAAKVQAACSPSSVGEYLCKVPGLVNGDRHSYTARAVNAVGESLDSTSVETWAYSAPTVESVTAEPTYDPAETQPNQGVVTVSIASADDVQSFRVASSDGRPDVMRPRNGAVETFTMKLTPGAANTTLTVTPISRFAPPTSGTNEGATRTATVHVAGSPLLARTPVATADGTSITIVSDPVDANGSDLATSLVYGVWQSGAPSCTMNSAGVAVLSGVEAQSTTGSFVGLQENVGYSAGVCGSNGYGAVLSQQAADSEHPDGKTWTKVPPNEPSGPATYSVAVAPTWSGNTATYGIATSPSISSNGGATTYYYYDGGNRSTTFDLDPRFVQSIQALSCKQYGWGELCSDPVDISPATGSAPTTAVVTFPSGTECREAPAEGDVIVSDAARGSASVSVDTATVPGRVTYTVSFTGRFLNLSPVSMTYDVCTPDPPPSPDPTPAP